MKGWYLKGVVNFSSGSHKKDILVIPLQNGNCIVIDTNRESFELKEIRLTVSQERAIKDKEIEVPENLASEIIFSHEVKQGKLHRHAHNVLSEFINTLGTRRKK